MRTKLGSNDSDGQMVQCPFSSVNARYGGFIPNWRFGEGDQEHFNREFIGHWKFASDFLMCEGVKDAKIGIKHCGVFPRLSYPNISLSELGSFSFLCVFFTAELLE